jgi:hypothetical protein
MVVDFFNDLTHLMRNAYIDDWYIPRLYFPSIRSCAIKLSCWWMKAIRNELREGNLYLNFQLLCEYILDIKGNESKWPSFRKWLWKTYRIK